MKQDELRKMTSDPQLLEMAWLYRMDQISYSMSQIDKSLKIMVRLLENPAKSQSNGRKEG